MSPTTAPERTGASGPYFTVPPAPPRRLMSPAGYAGIVALMALTVFVIVKLIAAFQEGAGGPGAQEGYEEVDLGQVTRELAPEAGGLVRDLFMLKVVLVLNPKAKDLGGLKAQAERRRNLFRDILLGEIISSKSDADLRKPGLLDSLKAEIRQRMNQELGGTKDGQEMVSKVLFPERRLPERR